MNKFYDMIASDYDSLIEEDIKNNSFPYGEHKEMQDIIASYIYEHKNVRQPEILDLGIGTASLYELLIPDTFVLTGIDSSEKMLEIAKLKFPTASFINHDLLRGLPLEIKPKKFDFIIINYLFKHFEFANVINYIHELAKYLAPFGKIFIGDIMFLDETRRKIYLTDHPEIVNYNYYFHCYSHLSLKMSDNLATSFMELNSYTGILIVEKYYEKSLHFDKTLVEYKTNTVKWKSSHSKT